MKLVLAFAMAFTAAAQAPAAKGKAAPTGAELLERARREAAVLIPKPVLYAVATRLPADAKSRESWRFDFSGPDVGAAVSVELEAGKAARVRRLPARAQGEGAGRYSSATGAGSHCGALETPFAERKPLEARLREYGLAPGRDGRFLAALFRPLDAKCAGLGVERDDPFKAAMPLPDALYGRALWVAEETERTLVLDGRSAETVLDRKKAPKK
ncbi:MAG: hypothetical protein WC969_11010 [Elusimicrobiota bacterium]|jgi:hypothetical protein